MDTKQKRNQEFRIGMVTQVDPANRFVLVKDQQGSDIRISLHLLPGMTTILPKPGERWFIKRQGIDWLLDSRVDDDVQILPITVMAPGDGQLSSSNNTYVMAPVCVVLSGGQNSIAYALDVRHALTIENTSQITGHLSMVEEVSYYGRLASGVQNIPILPGTSGTLYGGNFIEIPITMPGVKLGDNVYASPLISPGSGIVWSARVIGDDKVGICLANPTTSGVRIEKIKWAIDVWKHT